VRIVPSPVIVGLASGNPSLERGAVTAERVWTVVFLDQSPLRGRVTISSLLLRGHQARSLSAWRSSSSDRRRDRAAGLGNYVPQDEGRPMVGAKRAVWGAEQSRGEKV
jgi:hypothetical protein